VILYLFSVAFGNKVLPLNVQVKRGSGDPRALQNNWTFIPLFAAAFRVSGVFVISGLTVHKSTSKFFIIRSPIRRRRSVSLGSAMQIAPSDAADDFFSRVINLLICPVNRQRFLQLSIPLV